MRSPRSYSQATKVSGTPEAFRRRASMMPTSRHLPTHLCKPRLLFQPAHTGRCTTTIASKWYHSGSSRRFLSLLLRRHQQRACYFTVAKSSRLIHDWKRSEPKMPSFGGYMCTSTGHIGNIFTCPCFVPRDEGR